MARSTEALTDRPRLAPPDDLEHSLDLGLRVAAMPAGEPLGARKAMALFPHAQRARLNAGALRELPDGQMVNQGANSSYEFLCTLCLS